MMHRDKMKSKYVLEDYIYEMESRRLDTSAETEELDVYEQLQQKDKDLILAAELGKALLEKNEELSRQNEKIVEEYSQKLELLEQDRHSLRRKLQTTQSEYDARIVELQTDIKELNLVLEKRELELKQTEREKTGLITELTEQNERLTAQLKESCRTEEQLTNQLQCLRDQFNIRKSSLQDHVSSIEVLRDEIGIMSEKKLELERRVQSLLKEREEISSAMDEATDKIIMLEQQIHDQEIQIRHFQNTIEQLQITNSSLGNQLEALSNNNQKNCSKSLLHEMECEDECDSNDISPIQEESIKTYKQICELCVEIRHQMERRNESSLPHYEEITSQNFRVGLLSNVVKELSVLIKESLLSSSAHGHNLEIEAKLHQACETIERLQRDLSEKAEELKKQNEHIIDLTSKLKIREAELSGAIEERDVARSDLSKTHVAQDEVVRKALETRDKAISRKNAVEVELAKTRIDVLQVNSQLMEAIQQKVELSEQLDQWQIDMQCLLDDQVRNKLTTQETEYRQARTSDYESNGSAYSTADKKRSSSRSMFSFFQR